MSNFADRRGAIARAAHRTGRHLMQAALICGGVAFASAGAGAETYRSLRLGGALEGLVLAADPRLTFGSEGTLEFWIASDADSADNQCVIAHGGGEDSGFTVLMHGQRQAIYLQTPAGTYTVSFDFSDGGFHHVAFITAGGQTSAVIDGATPTQPGDGDERVELMPAWFSFGAVTSPGLALDIGCTTPAPFDGWLASLRFWDKALEPDELRWASNSYGYPNVNRHGILTPDQRRTLTPGRWVGVVGFCCESKG